MCFGGILLTRLPKIVRLVKPWKGIRLKGRKEAFGKALMPYVARLVCRVPIEGES